LFAVRKLDYFEIQVGSSSRDLPLKGTVEVK
jgi:hypothetical protein